MSDWFDRRTGNTERCIHCGGDRTSRPKPQCFTRTGPGQWANRHSFDNVSPQELREVRAQIETLNRQYVDDGACIEGELVAPDDDEEAVWETEGGAVRNADGGVGGVPALSPGAGVGVDDAADRPQD